MRTTLQVVAIILCVILVIGGFAQWRAKRRAQGMSCASNLQSVSLAARLYSGDHQEVFARSLLEMSNEVITPKVLICPADSARKGSSQWAKLTSTPWESLTTNDLTYVWLASGQPETNWNQLLWHCPVHGYFVRADGGVVGRDGKKVRSSKDLFR